MISERFFDPDLGMIQIQGVAEAIEETRKVFT